MDEDDRRVSTSSTSTTGAHGGWPELPGVQHRFVDLPGLCMHVALAGPPLRSGAPDLPALLLHGFPQHWWQWRHVIPSLAKERAVIVPDLRGFGWTDAPDGSYRLEAHLQDVVALLDALGVQRVHVVAHDWAAIVGMCLALDLPRRVGGLVSLTLPHPWLRFHPRLMAQMRGAWHLPLMASPAAPRLVGRGRQRLVRHMLFGAFTVARGAIGPDDGESYLERLREPARARAGAALYRELIVPEFLRVLRGAYADRRLTVPTVALLGAGDAISDPRTLGGHEGRADDLTIEIVEGAGHFIPEERPDVVVARAQELFARVV
jgi:pimeloyl-ACP methyl ester carboxylesterase